jgi:hypothetical protein
MTIEFLETGISYFKKWNPDIFKIFEQHCYKAFENENFAKNLDSENFEVSFLLWRLGA